MRPTSHGTCIQHNWISDHPIAWSVVSMFTTFATVHNRSLSRHGNQIKRVLFEFEKTYRKFEWTIYRNGWAYTLPVTHIEPRKNAKRKSDLLRTQNSHIYYFECAPPWRFTRTLLTSKLLSVSTCSGDSSCFYIAPETSSELEAVRRSFAHSIGEHLRLCCAHRYNSKARKTVLYSECLWQFSRRLLLRSSREALLWLNLVSNDYLFYIRCTWKVQVLSYISNILLYKTSAKQKATLS